MKLTESFILISLLNFILLPSSISQLSLDSITPTQTLKDGDVLVSSGKIFALGFFSPGNSVNRYVGVWYNKLPEQTVVWVANRDSPVTDTSGLLGINGNGGLVIYGKDRSIPLWSANVTLSFPNNSMAKLLDTGNLVLLEDEGSQRATWESFNHPSNTVLAYMKLGLNRRSGLSRILTSWKSPDDPGTGNCSCKIDPSGYPQLVLYKGGVRRWRTGPWTGNKWSGLPKVQTTVGLFSLIFVNNQEEIYLMYDVANDSSTLYTRGVVDESGRLQSLMWNDQQDRWIQMRSDPDEWCNIYGQCGPNSNCDPYNNNDSNFACTCLPGFEPQFPRDWRYRIGIGGCVRKTRVSTCRNGEGFMKVARVKVPDSPAARVNVSLSLKECRAKCLMDCSCTGYSSADENGGGIGCVTWHGNLMDTRTYSKTGQESQDLYVRVDATSLAEYRDSSGSLSKKARLAISILSVLGFPLFAILMYWLLKLTTKGRRGRNDLTYFEESVGLTALDESRINSEVPFFHLPTIADATSNFSVANKLGEGGFGSVYKGILYNGNEIAVKRLSKNSGQGVEEFKNEVLLIANLQHRNLVRILGCCVEDDEKMVIYEYLPNRGLDSFIFDETKRALLDWTRRFDIIFGIARGLLYLHEDSRLRIIHRDLKASNVLLDACFNPKIADFGMARMFSGDQTEANTNRVVGTYGYMSPEYAMEGLFSVKSDVYSFGVLLLEIITGRKNTGYYHEEYPDSNLIGHVWELWKEDRALEIIDSCMGESYHIYGVMRCIQIAFLCVQEFASDRPTMSTVVFMLGNEAALPSAKRPAFLVRKTCTSEATTFNDVTCTSVKAR